MCYGLRYQDTLPLVEKKCQSHKRHRHITTLARTHILSQDQRRAMMVRYPRHTFFTATNRVLEALDYPLCSCILYKI